MKKRFLTIITLMLLLTMAISNISFAKISDYVGTNNLDFYDPSKAQDTPSTYDDVTGRVGALLGTIQVIGTIISVGVLMILGIKFMLGSVEEKASYKRAFIPYLVGAAILFTGTTLPNIIYNLTNSSLG